MDEHIIASAEIMGRFCRLKMKGQQNLPVRSSEMGVLIFVEKKEEPVTPSMISEFFSITKPSVTAQVSELIRKGYLRKRQSQMDKRSYTLELTEKGKELLDATFHEYYSSTRTLREHMGEDDFLHFMELMKKANDILEEMKK